ncbi:YoaK family protein [Jatrophihabitans sp. YIM 134969]
MVEQVEGTRAWWADYVAHPRHGPLPLLLVLLTVSTGLVDAVSILALGRVFVANMTGNVVFIGFALAHAPGFSLQASLVALGAFLCGAGTGGAFVSRPSRHHGRLLRDAVAVEFLLLGAATVVLGVAHAPFGPLAQDLAVGLAAAALGLQNAAVRSLAVPDLTTTVLTMTLTGIAADIRHGQYRVVARRLVAVTAMLAGAAGGGVLVRVASAAWALGLAAGLVGVVAAAAAHVATGHADWHH